MYSVLALKYLRETDQSSDRGDIPPSTHADNDQWTPNTCMSRFFDMMIKVGRRLGLENGRHDKYLGEETKSFLEEMINTEQVEKIWKKCENDPTNYPQRSAAASKSASKSPRRARPPEGDSSTPQNKKQRTQRWVWHVLCHHQSNAKDGSIVTAGARASAS